MNVFEFSVLWYGAGAFMKYLQTRQKLLLRAKDPNDETAWSSFIEYYQGFIAMLLFKLNVPESEHPDLTQEFLVEVWEEMQKFERDHSKAKIRSWRLSTVIRNTIYNYMSLQRASKKREERSEQEDNEHNLSHRKRVSLIRLSIEWVEYMANWVLEHLRQFFSGKAIDLFVLTNKGKSAEEISLELDIRPNTVYVLRNRIKGRIMTKMKNLRKWIEF